MDDTSSTAIPARPIEVLREMFQKRADQLKEDKIAKAPEQHLKNKDQCSLAKDISKDSGDKLPVIQEGTESPSDKLSEEVSA